MKNAPPIYLTSEIRQIEQMIFALPDPPNLMERAGLAAAQITADKLLSKAKNRILVLAGPGNNGGDAFVVARYLKQWNLKVTVVFTGFRDELSTDAQCALDAYTELNGAILNEIPANVLWDVIIDGLFGIGLDQHKNRPLNEKYLNLIKTVNGLNAPIVALDIPSGLGSDNGGVQQEAIHATYTTTFIGLKPGLFTHDGPDHCGEVILCDLELNPATLVTPHLWTINQSSIKQLLPSPRPANSHKGTYGSIGIIGGATSMTGAALLAGKSALKLGAGRVYLGLIGHDAPVVDTTQPELMFRSAQDLFTLRNINCLIVGPGLGMKPDSHTWVDS
ncbi:MAG: NAD(P)H-hydrate epimerase, partial [Nitrosomonas sp.]|nr:NAD(P)H-hydrate epimerase [Nitrosomonas sp.]